MVMKKRSAACNNRLTVVGPMTTLKAFDENVTLAAAFGARYADALELSATRLGWQFESDTPPLESLKRLSAQHPRLTFLLDYDRDGRKGLAKAKAGQLEHHEVTY